MAKLQRIFFVPLFIVVLNITWLFGNETSAQPTVQLLVKPFIEDNTIHIGSEIKHITLTARVNLDGLQYHWDFQGPGKHETDPDSRKLYYTFPEHLTTEFSEVTIMVIVTDDKGESATDRVTFTLHDPTPIVEIPPPTSTVTPTPSLMSSEEIEKLLEKADRDFKITLYTDAFGGYKEVLRLAPGNQHARQKIHEMAVNLKQWAEKAYSEADYKKAKRYFQRYVEIAQYMIVDLREQNVTSEIKKLQNILNELRISLSPEIEEAMSEVSQTPIPKPTPTPNISSHVKRPGKLYAVIIGIGDYLDERFPDLRFSENDAQEIYNVLIETCYGGIPEDHTTLLLGQNATDRNIKKAIGVWASQQAKEEDTVLIYYAGYGAFEEGDNYWVTYDADYDDLYATALNSDDIHEMFDRLKAKHLIVFLDSGYISTTTRQSAQTTEIHGGIPWDTFSGKQRMIISASDGTQASLEFEQKSHSLFAYYLLEGLKGNADINEDGKMDLEEVWNFVNQQVSEASKENETSQIPQVHGKLITDLPLTFNVAFLQEKAAEEEFEAKQEWLIEIYRTGDISAEQFKKALKILKNKENDQILEDFLEGKISLELFQETF